MALDKDRRWANKNYNKWVATLPCANCSIQDETIVAHHMKHRCSPYGGAGMGMKADDWLTMPLCYSCHNRAHNGDADVLNWQHMHVFKTLTSAFKSGILDYTGKGSVLDLFLLKGKAPTGKLFGEDLDD